MRTDWLAMPKFSRDKKKTVTPTKPTTHPSGTASNPKKVSFLLHKASTRSGACHSAPVEVSKKKSQKVSELLILFLQD